MATSASFMLRTLWSSPVPESQMGYQTASAEGATFFLALWIKVTSRSLPGHSSRRP